MQKANRVEPAVVAGAAAGLLAVVGVLVVGLYLLVREVREVTTYVGSPGSITVSEAVHQEGSGAKLGSDRWRAEIRYRFRVGSVDVEGRGVQYTRWSRERAPVDALLRRYPVGAAVTVHHDPSDPNRSLLEPGLSPLSLAFTGIGLLGVAGAVWLLRRRRRT